MIDEIEERAVAIAELCHRYGVRTLSVFGSAAGGAFDLDRSDLDFLVTFDSSNQLGAFDTFFGLKESLEALFGRPVDLVSAEAIINPYVKRTVEASRHVLYAA